MHNNYIYRYSSIFMIFCVYSDMIKWMYEVWRWIIILLHVDAIGSLIYIRLKCIKSIDKCASSYIFVVWKFLRHLSDFYSEFCWFERKLQPFICIVLTEVVFVNTESLWHYLCILSILCCSELRPVVFCCIQRNVRQRQRMKKRQK